MLRQGLGVLDDLGVSSVLITCDEDNVASIRTIVGNGGVLEDAEAIGGGVRKRRYWITMNR